jgi:hypothetical protein
MIFKNLPLDKLNLNTIEITQEKLNVDIKHFLENDIILISSGTATGKTKNIAKLAKELK